MNKYIKLSLILLTSVFLITACSKEKKKTAKQENIVTVESKPVITTLSFSGTLKPHKQYSVVAPNAGTIESMNFKYGQKIEKGQVLFTLDSSKQEEQFESALSDYLKAKQTLSTDQGQLQSTEGLFKKGLVSEDEYRQAKNSYYLSRLGMLQAEAQLQKSLRIFKTNIDVFSLSIEDIAEISKTIARTKKLDVLSITSPVTGVALFPAAGSSGGDDSGSGDSSGSGGGSVGVGSEVKEGQVLVTIGEFKGLIIGAKASEVNINQLKPGLPATVTSVAFPGITLKGYIHEIDSQAITSGGLPQFKVLILIPRLPEDARKVIKVGMSAQATVEIKSAPKIQIPISAVFQKRGQSTVKKIVNGKPVDTSIETGKTSMDSVVVLSGLKAGDKIVGGN